jgi:hypothetical protein
MAPAQSSTCCGVRFSPCFDSGREPVAFIFWIGKSGLFDKSAQCEGCVAILVVGYGMDRPNERHGQEKKSTRLQRAANLLQHGGRICTMLQSQLSSRKPAKVVFWKRAWATESGLSDVTKMPMFMHRDSNAKNTPRRCLKLICYRFWTGRSPSFLAQADSGARRKFTYRFDIP